MTSSTDKKMGGGGMSKIEQKDLSLSYLFDESI